MKIKTLGKCRFESPSPYSVSDGDRIPIEIVRRAGKARKGTASLELAGPRARLFFSGARSRAGIVTCGGLCPGLNNVIRSLVHQLNYLYGVKQILGFRHGYRGLDPNAMEKPFALTLDMVDSIHEQGGTILGTSRGPVPPALMLETLRKRKVNMLFCVGGDGTLRGAHTVAMEAERSRYPLSVIGIPKTIDNDIEYVTRTFGYTTALEEARRVLDGAHNEAHSALNGVGLVKLMGRDAGFIAVGATIASQDVNFTLIPEVPFKLSGRNGFLAALKRRILARHHAVIVVAEGAGQDLFPPSSDQFDASGNRKLHDIGPFLKEKIQEYFRAESIPVDVKYFDPSYSIRSRPANCEDAMLCDLLARRAADAAMAGKTDMVIGYLHNLFVHVPLSVVAGAKKRVEPAGPYWHAVLMATGQPAAFR